MTIDDVGTARSFCLLGHGFSIFEKPCPRAPLEGHWPAKAGFVGQDQGSSCLGEESSQEGLVAACRLEERP